MHSHDPANIPYTVVSKVCMGHYLAFSSPLQDPLSHRRKEIWGRNRSFSRKKFSTASLAYVYTLIDHSLTKDLQGSSIGAASVVLMCLRIELNQIFTLYKSFKLGKLDSSKASEDLFRSDKFDDHQ